MNRNKYYWSVMTGPLLVILLLCSCTKTKVGETFPYQTQLADAGSSIRIFNFFNNEADVTVNNIPLTNYGSSQATQIGLSLFPSGVWPNQDNGDPFVIPTYLVDKSGNSHIILAPRSTELGGSFGGYTLSNIDTVLHDDPLTPKDYYALSDGTLQIVQRNAAAPTQPDHFKIRILNLMKGPDNLGFYGPVTLTYADGSVVSPVTSNVKADTASGYIELPLGCYQLKVFMALPGGAPDYTRQLAELPAQPDFDGDNQTPAGQPPQEAVFPLIRTLQAGTTYSIVITGAVVNQSWAEGGNTYHWNEQVNAYRMVTEQSPGANTIYACMDAVNGLRMPGITIKVDGAALGSNLAFGQYATHKVYVWGTHTVQAVNQQGAVIAQQDIKMNPNDYLTAWVYLNPGGMPDIVFSSTDMTSTLYQNNSSGNIAEYTPDNGNISLPDDGTNGSLRITNSNYTWQSRFLNLSEDIPYATFGNDGVLTPGYGYAGSDQLFTGTITPGGDSLNFATATINLGRGVTNAQNPFLIYPLPSIAFWSGLGSSQANADEPQNLGTNIIVFQSDPGPPALVPGSALVTIPGVAWKSFVANPAMYTAPWGPEMEPGFYSVALIGNVGQATAGQAKLIYVKHNQ